MKRISTDADYLNTGKVVIDADGIPIYVPDRSDMDDADNALSTTIDNRIPSNLALRVDTTVGTRIFAGDTMIYGDTGGRRLSSYFSHLTTHLSTNLSIHRFGNIVEMVVHATTFDLAGVPIWSKVADIPSGFSPRTVFRHQLTGSNTVLEFRPSGEIRTAGTPIEQGTVVSFRVQWITTDPWPTLLPGLPA